MRSFPTCTAPVASLIASVASTGRWVSSAGFSVRCVTTTSSITSISSFRFAFLWSNRYQAAAASATTAASGSHAGMPAFFSPRSASDKPAGIAREMFDCCSEKSRETPVASGRPVNCLATMPSTTGAR